MCWASCPLRTTALALIPPVAALPQDQARISGALYVLRFLARKYEFRDEEERGPLDGVVNATFPTLLQIFQVWRGVGCRLLARHMRSAHLPHKHQRLCYAALPGLPHLCCHLTPSCSAADAPAAAAAMSADAAGHGLVQPRAGGAAQAGVQDLLVRLDGYWGVFSSLVAGSFELGGRLVEGPDCGSCRPDSRVMQSMGITHTHVPASLVPVACPPTCCTPALSFFPPPAGPPPTCPSRPS